jgi:hypothetical protein
MTESFFRVKEEIAEQLELCNQFRKSNDERLGDVVSSLVEAGVYSATGCNGQLTAEQMVAWYGAHWHEYAGLHHCPHCNIDLRDHKNGPPFQKRD